MAEHPKAFGHVGLLFTEPPGSTELLFIESSDKHSLQPEKSRFSARLHRYFSPSLPTGHNPNGDTVSRDNPLGNWADGGGSYAAILYAHDADPAHVGK